MAKRQIKNTKCTEYLALLQAPPTTLTPIKYIHLFWKAQEKITYTNGREKNPDTHSRMASFFSFPFSPFSFCFILFLVKNPGFRGFIVFSHTHSGKCFCAWWFPSSAFSRSHCRKREKLFLCHPGLRRIQLSMPID